jgi:hypothetical protein
MNSKDYWVKLIKNQELNLKFGKFTEKLRKKEKLYGNNTISTPNIMKNIMFGKCYVPAQSPFSSIINLNTVVEMIRQH